MIKQVYDNRVDEILDFLKNKIINERFDEKIDSYVNDYEKMSNLQIRNIEIKQRKEAEIFKKLEKDLEYYKDQTNEIGLIANGSEAHKEFKVIVKYLENFLKEVNK